MGLCEPFGLASIGEARLRSIFGPYGKKVNDRGGRLSGAPATPTDREQTDGTRYLLR